MGPKLAGAREAGLGVAGIPLQWFGVISELLPRCGTRATYARLLQPDVGKFPQFDPDVLPDARTKHSLVGRLEEPEHRIELAVIRALEYGKNSDSKLLERVGEKRAWTFEAVWSLVDLGLVRQGGDGDDPEYYALTLLGWYIASQIADPNAVQRPPRQA